MKHRNRNKRASVKKAIVIAGILTVVVALVALVASGRSGPSPPHLTIMSTEPAAIFDNDVEMRLATIRIANTNSVGAANSPRNYLYVRSSGRASEASIGSRWEALVGIEPQRDIVKLPSGEHHETLLLLPGGTEACRVWLEFTEASSGFSLKGVAQFIATRLPAGIRSRVSYKFWRWVGFPGAGPSSKWRQLHVHLPLPLKEHNSSLLQQDAGLSHFWASERREVDRTSAPVSGYFPLQTMRLDCHTLTAVPGTGRSLRRRAT